MKIDIKQPLTFSEIGRKDNQEDSVYPTSKALTTASWFFVLCDGMGGHDSGEVASDTVCRALGRYFEAHAPQDGVATAAYFNEALQYAYDELDKKDTGALKKMGTTMTCLYLHKKGYLVAHIGDSRIYHVRPENTDLEKGRLGIIYQSSDHSLVNDLLKAGELTEEEAINFPQKNVITRAMQPNLERRYKADVFSFTDIKAGDYFFLCSDGVLEQLTNERLCEILSLPISDEEKLEAIRQVCYGKTKDNYTCYLIPIDKVVAEDDDSHDGGDDIIAGVVLESEGPATLMKETNHSASQNIVEQSKPMEYSTSQSVVPKQKLPWKGIALAAFIIAALTYSALTLKNRYTSSERELETAPIEAVQEPEQKIRGVFKRTMPDEIEEYEDAEDMKASDEVDSPDIDVMVANQKQVTEPESTYIKVINTGESNNNTEQTQCIYNPIPTSKEENTTSSDTLVAEDSDVHTKQSM